MNEEEKLRLPTFIIFKRIISQRISSVMLADKIVIIEDGEITDFGTHQELISKKGIYSEIYKLQFAYQEVD